MKMKLTVFLFFISQIYSGQLPQKVLLCGVCKDVASRVKGSIKIMEKIGDLFSDYRVIVYENNSTDLTPEILKQWQNFNKKVYCISEVVPKKKLEGIIINRMEKGELFNTEVIARARNIVLDIANSVQYKEYEYIIWMDMDFVLEPNYDGIIEVFTTDRSWDAIFAYGIDPAQTHWDWYAFRDSRCPLGSELLGNDWWYLPKKLQLTTKNDWYPVSSAFGGCAIYKKSSIKGCRYSGLVTEDLAKLSLRQIEDPDNSTHPIILKYLTDKQKLRIIKMNKPTPYLPDITKKNLGFLIESHPEDIAWRMSSFGYKYPTVCEHVPFHATMILNGHDQLYINPRLIFRYGGK